MGVILREEARYDVPKVPLASPELIYVTICFHVVVGEIGTISFFQAPLGQNLPEWSACLLSITQICTGNCFY